MQKHTLPLAALIALLLACGDDRLPAFAVGDPDAGARVDGAAGSGGSSGGQGGSSASAGAGGSGGQAGSSGSLGGVGPSGCQVKPLFPASMPWNQRVDQAPLDARSEAVIGALQTRGFGLGRLQIDFSIDVLCADDSAPFRTFEKTTDFFEGECDDVPVPVPANGHVEGYPDYHCEDGGDCHLIVIHGPSHTLYEQWIASIDPDDVYTGGCLAVWDLDRVYDDGLRGDQCSSADAAGLPIAPLLFDADEVAAGEIAHAVRFALPNTHLRHRTYVRPATHATGAASAGEDGVAYGDRLRLRADYPIDSLPSAGARTLARALQTYGMILADGGNVALMGQADQGTQAKWDGLLGPRDLQEIEPSDFELVATSEPLTWTGSCELSQ